MNLFFRLAAMACLGISLGAHGASLTLGDQRGNARAVMEAAGVLDGLGYSIDWKEFPNAAPLLEALRAGYLDAGAVGDAPLTFAAAAGLQAKAIQASRYLGNALIVNGDSAARTVADLKGQKIAAVKGSSGHALALNAVLSLQQATIDLYQQQGLIPAHFPAAQVIASDYFTGTAP